MINELLLVLLPLLLLLLTLLLLLLLPFTKTGGQVAIRPPWLELALLTRSIGFTLE